MNSDTKTLLHSFLKMISDYDRNYFIKSFKTNDETRLVRVAIALLDHNDYIDTDDIRMICEEIGGEEYTQMLLDPDKFKETFADVVFSRICDVRNIISEYITLSK